MLNIGVQSLLISWQRNAIYSVEMRRVLPLISLMVKIRRGHAALHGLEVPWLGGYQG